MIDIQKEKVLTMAQAAHSLPGHPSICTLWRWRLRGVRGVKLETLAIGGRRYTSAEALERFIERTTAAADGPPSVFTILTNRQREAAIRRAEKVLRRAGI